MSKEKHEKLKEDLAVAHMNISPVVWTDTLYRRALERIEYLEENEPTCDGGCSQEDGPEETCSLHGRRVSEVWGIVASMGSERDRAIAQLREVQKIAIGWQHRYKNAEAALKESSEKYDAKRIDLRAEMDYLLSAINERSGNDQED